MIDPLIAVFLIAMIGVGGALGRSPLRAGGQLGGDGSHGTTMTLGTTDNVDPAMTEELVVYTFTVTNTGGGALANLSLAITYDSDSTYVSSAAGTFTTIGESAGVVTATIASVAAGGTAVCTVTVRAPTTGQTLSLSATATSTNATTQNDTETTVVKLVTKDAASGKYFPASATEWSNFSDCVGVTWAPFLLWLLQEASGNPADSIGAFGATANSLNYQQAVTGYTRKAIVLDDNSTDYCRNLSASLPNIASESALWMWFGDLPGSHIATDMQMCLVGQNPNAGTLVRMASTNNVNVQFTSGGISTTLLNSAGGQVRPWAVQVDRTNSANRGITDAAIAEPAWQTGLNNVWLWLGSGLTPGMSALYAVGFRGANAELTRTQIKAGLQRLGWTVAWTP